MSGSGIDGRGMALAGRAFWRGARAPRAAFTLTELLVVITVIGILASSLLFALYGTIEDAKVARTRAQIAKLHDLIMTRWDAYRTRAVRISWPAGVPAAARRDALVIAQLRLDALRDLMRMELPDRKTDVTDGPATIALRAPYNSYTTSIAAPSLWRYYNRRATAGWTVEYEGAECLYLILSAMRDADSSALDFLRDSEIGDLDDDGMPEVLDAWGRPIVFLRWPAGFIAHPGQDFIFGTADDIPSYSNLQPFGVDANDYVVPEDRDPFDPLRVDNRQGATMPNAGSVNGTAKYYFNYALYPLICSGGPDQVWDIVRFDYNPSAPSTVVSFSYFRNQPNPYGGWVNDPYSILPTCGRRLGEPFLESSGYVDNITNHGLGD